MKANVFVTLKREVLDPQGNAVERSLQSLGFQGVRGVRVGKLIELEVDAASKGEAEAQVKAMCQKLLANAVIEDFRFELEG